MTLSIRFLLRLGLGTCATVLGLNLWVQAAPEASLTPLWTQNAQQLLLIVAPQWTSVSAQLQRYQRVDAHSRWEPVGTPMPVVLGRKGLGWGRGLFAASDTNGDARHEGDERSPAGIFALGTAFGLDSPAQAQAELGLKMPYLPLSDSIRCIGDAQSQHYNELVDITQVARDWPHPNANEDMRRDAIRDEGAYHWGIFVKHNVPDNPPGMQRDRVSGSCIFMHIWKGPGIGTSGCTAMARSNLETLLRWLDAAQHPLLVQLSRADYRRLQRRWQLPADAP